MLRSSPEYLLIKDHYGKRRARRSGVLLIRHIDEGLEILEAYGATELAKRAFCLHPLLQADRDLLDNWERVRYMDPRTVLLAMEYRRVANACLSHRVLTHWSEIELSPLEDVNKMLIADKIQNRKDFDKCHKGTHKRSRELDTYFKHWFTRLGIRVLPDQLKNFNSMTIESFHGDVE